MRVDIISAIPDLLSGPLTNSIVGRAVKNNLVNIIIHDLHDYGKGNYKQVDDKPFGGVAGMVLSPEPLDNCIEKLKTERTYDEIIFFCPDGAHMNQSLINAYSLKENLMIICGHYKGIDQRIRDLHVTKELSLGDFVISGGELAAAVFTDAIVRIIPKAIGNEESALTDSFQDELLAPPIYTRPASFKGMEVPEVLLSGNHANIQDWLIQKSEERTKHLRPDLNKNQ